LQIFEKESAPMSNECMKLNKDFVTFLLLWYYAHNGDRIKKINMSWIHKLR